MEELINKLIKIGFRFDYTNKVLVFNDNSFVVTDLGLYSPHIGIIETEEQLMSCIQ